MDEPTLKDRVQKALREQVAPALELDPAELTVVEVVDGIASVRFGAQCLSCAGGVMALVAAVEQELKPLLPEVEFVEPVA